MNLPQLLLEGSPAAMGRRHGQELGQGIRRLRRSLLRYLGQVTVWVGLGPLLGLLYGLAGVTWRHLPPRLQAELKGVAAGADLDLATVLLINVLDDIANNCPRCSALAVLPELTAGGSCLAGRNLDYPLFIRELVELQLLLVMQPDEGLPVVSLAWPGYVGVCTGMNRAGVSLSQLSAMSRECSLRGLPAALRFRQALMEAETLGGVATRILQAPATIGNNVLLAGPQEAAVLELSARRGVVRRPQEGLITVTNHYQTAAMEKVKGRFPRRPPGAALSAYHFSEAYSRAREARLQELAVGRRLDAAGLQGVLADAQVANAGTVVSVVYAPGDVKMWVARGQTAPVNQGPFMEVAPWA